MKYIFLIFTLIFASVMAASESVSIQADPDKTYVLRSVNTSSGDIPALVSFECYEKDKLLGPATLAVLPQFSPELIDFWKPLLRRIYDGHMISIEVRGGRFSYSRIPEGHRRADGFWVPYTPAIFPDISNMRLIQETDTIQP